MGERRGSDVRLLGVGRHVHQLADVVRHRGEPLQTALGQRAHAHLQREIGDDGGEVAVAGAFAVPVDRALHLRGAAEHTGEAVGHAASGVVVRVDADGDVVAEV